MGDGGEGVGDSEERSEERMLSSSMAWDTVKRRAKPSDHEREFAGGTDETMWRVEAVEDKDEVVEGVGGRWKRDGGGETSSEREKVESWWLCVRLSWRRLKT